MKHKKDISVQINTAISQGKMSRAWHITLQDKRKQKYNQVHCYRNCSFTLVKVVCRCEIYGNGKTEFQMGL